MDLGIRELSNSWRQRNEVGAEYCLLSRWNKNKNCDSRPPENEEKIVMIQKNVKDFNDIEDKKEDRILKWHLKPSNQFMEHRKYVWLLKSMHQIVGNTGGNASRDLLSEFDSKDLVNLEHKNMKSKKTWLVLNDFAFMEFAADLSKITWRRPTGLL